MIAIAFRFPAGRCHATPWGRHVNEAEVEWPPSPWRVLRALIATWHRKVDPERSPEAVLDRLIERLAGSLPVYSVPEGVRAHSRHYMPVGSKPSLIFDAFVALDRDAQLIVAWPNERVDGEERALLERLLRDIGFLGRAESWVEARMLDAWAGGANCYPSELSVNMGTGEALEPVQLLAPLPPGQYRAWRAEVVAAHGLDGKRLNRSQKAILATLPERLLDALRTDTADLQRAGWSQAPGSRFATYQRPHGLLAAKPRMRIHRRSSVATTVRFALAGKPLPRIEDAVRIGEIMRMAAMKQAERVTKGKVPAVLSGHDMGDGNRHGHAFYLPEDADRDGWIDHVLVHAPEGLSSEAIKALHSIERIWERNRGEWKVLFEGYGTVQDLQESAYLNYSSTWRSVTPYLHPWFAKKRFGVVEQVLRECRARGLVEPAVETMPTIAVGKGDRPRRAVHFHRFRNRRGLTQPDTQGRFLTLSFPEPIAGPLALGFGCHFGLGMFMPAG